MLDKIFLFASSWQIWGGAVLAAGMLGVICGFLGVYITLHRIVFVSAAMSEVSSLGVMVAFWLAELDIVRTSHHSEDVLPLIFAAIFTGIFSTAMATQASTLEANRTKSAEAFIGVVYLLSTAGLLLIGDRITRGAHDVANILFGNSVVVDQTHLAFLGAICIPIFVIHLWLRKDLLFCSFDPSMAITLGYPVKNLRIFLLVSLGVVISIGTRTIGALPVFAFSVLPAVASLALFEDLKYSFLGASIIGFLSAFTGYLFSFLFSFPTGASMTITAGVFLVMIILIRKFLNHRSGQ